MAQVQKSLFATIREVMQSRDSATGTLSRPAFERIVDAWIGGGASARRPASSLLLIQIDWATRGGRSGPPKKTQLETVMKNAGGILANSIRMTDVLGRVDDDMFGVLLPSTPAQQAEFVSRRLRAGIAERSRHSNFPVTISVGLATALTDGTWDRAMAALAEAKAAGGNRTVVSNVEDPHSAR